MREQDGKITVLAAPCDNNKCPFCGPRKAFRVMRRVDKLVETIKEYDLGLNVYFITFDLRASEWISPRESFDVIKGAVYEALRQSRLERKGGYRRVMNAGAGGRVIKAWHALDLRYISSIDVTDRAYAHAHILVHAKRQDGGEMPTNPAFARFLWVAMNRGIARRVQKRLDADLAQLVQQRSELIDPFDDDGDLYNNRAPLGHLDHFITLASAKSQKFSKQCASGFYGSNSLGYVDVQDSTGENQAARYMSLHNGKVWKSASSWVYPARYRRLSASRYWLPKIEREISDGWQYVKQSLSLAVTKSLANGLPVQLGEPDRAGTVKSAEITGSLEWDKSTASERVKVSSAVLGTGFGVKSHKLTVSAFGKLAWKHGKTQAELTEYHKSLGFEERDEFLAFERGGFKAAEYWQKFNRAKDMGLIDYDRNAPRAPDPMRRENSDDSVMVRDWLATVKRFDSETALSVQDEAFFLRCLANAKQNAYYP